MPDGSRYHANTLRERITICINGTDIEDVPAEYCADSGALIGAEINGRSRNAVQMLEFLGPVEFARIDYLTDLRWSELLAEAEDDAAAAAADDANDRERNAV